MATEIVKLIEKYFAWNGKISRYLVTESSYLISNAKISDVKRYI